MLKFLPNTWSRLPNIVYMKSTSKTHCDLDELEKEFMFIEAKLHVVKKERDGRRLIHDVSG